MIKKYLKGTQAYEAIFDILDLKGRLWYAGSTRKLTEIQAMPYIEKGKICIWVKPAPKKFVILDGKEMTWGEYLKTKKRRKPCNRWGCKPSADVCVRHEQPLECRHGCIDAKKHTCQDLAINVKIELPISESLK